MRTLDVQLSVKRNARTLLLLDVRGRAIARATPITISTAAMTTTPMIQVFLLDDGTVICCNLECTQTFEHMDGCVSNAIVENYL